MSQGGGHDLLVGPGGHAYKKPGGGGPGGSVNSVSAGDATITIGGTATDPTVVVGAITPGANGTIALGATAPTTVSLSAPSAGAGATASKIDHSHDLSQAIAPTWTATHTWETQDNGTTTVTRPQVVQHRNNAAGAPAATYGVGQQFKLDSAARNLRTAGQQDVVWIVATDAAESGQFQFFAMTGGSLPATPTLTLDGVSGAGAFVTDAATNTSLAMLTLDHRSSGTTAASYGTGILLRGQDASGSAGGDDLVQLDGILTTATAGAEATAFVIKARTAGSAPGEVFRITGTASIGIVTTATNMQLGAAATITNSSGLMKIKSGSTAGSCAFSPGSTSTYTTRGITTSGATLTHDFIGIAHTGQTASTESPEFQVTMPTKTWATGALASQAFMKVTAPTIAFAAASTAAIVSTAQFAAPVAGTNATITDGYSAQFLSKIRVESAVALGAGGAATLGLTGGSGPATTTQNEWIAIDTQNGRRFVPAWA